MAGARAYAEARIIEADNIVSNLKSNAINRSETAKLISNSLNVESEAEIAQSENLQNARKHE